MPVSIDEQFVEFVVKSLVTKPDEVKVVRTIDEKGVLLELTVDPEDLGRVIGKRGATAQSIRTLLRALGTKNDARYNLKIVDNGIEPPRREERQSRDEEPTAAKDDEKEVASSQDQDDDVWGDNEEASSGESDLAAKTRKELEDLDDLDV